MLLIFEGKLKNTRLEEMREYRNGFNNGYIKPHFVVWEAPREGNYVVESWASKGICYLHSFVFRLIFEIISN